MVSQCRLKWVKDNYLTPLLNKMSKESKWIFLLVNFDVDVLKYDNHALTNEFHDSLSSHLFSPQIIQPIRITAILKHQLVTSFIIFLFYILF